MQLDTQLFPVKVMIVQPRFRHNYDDIMQAYSATDLTKGSALFTLDDHEYHGDRDKNEFVTFIGNFELEI